MATTPEELVRIQYPKAALSLKGDLYEVLSNKPLTYTVLGDGPTPDDAWADAARFLMASETKIEPFEPQMQEPRCPNCNVGYMSISGGGSLWCDACESKT